MRLAKMIPAALALLAVSAGTATAQYKWRDASGSVHYSDQPPPAGIRAQQLPPAPPPPAAGSRLPPPSAGPRQASSYAPAGAPASPQAAADRAKAESAAREKACDGMRGEARMLRDGMRVVRINEQGEREFLSDEDRDKRIAELDVDIKAVCGER